MNRRILNAASIEYDGIEFKSKAEKMVYQTLKENGFSPVYENEKFHFFKGFYPKVPFYDLGKDRHLHLNKKKLLDITYTPDFTFWLNDTKIIIEVKGWANDIFPLKKKLFRAHLETLDYPVIYAEIHTKRQLLEFINIIRNEETK